MTINIQNQSVIVVTKSGKNLHVYAPNHSMTLIPFQMRPEMGWAKGGGIIYKTTEDFTGTTEEFLDIILSSESYKNYYAEYLKKKEEREAERDHQKVIASNYNKEDINEVYQAVKYNTKNGQGWHACDILTEGNALTKLITSHIGSFTATPYDNGQILMKGAKGKVKLFNFHNRIEDKNYHTTLDQLFDK